MSISSAPGATASAVSASLISSEARPLGNAVATAATEIEPVVGVAVRGAERLDGVRHHVAVDAHRGHARQSSGREASGFSAFATSERTLPGVSAPSSVVRSISSMILSSAHAFEVVLIDRVPRPAARCSRPTASTPESPWR